MAENYSCAPSWPLRATAVTQVKTFNGESDTNEQQVPSRTATAPTNKAAMQESDGYWGSWQLMLRLSADKPAAGECAGQPEYWRLRVREYGDDSNDSESGRQWQISYLRQRRPAKFDSRRGVDAHVEWRAHFFDAPVSTVRYTLQTERH